MKDNSLFNDILKAVYEFKKDGYNSKDLMILLTIEDYMYISFMKEYHDDIVRYNKLFNITVTSSCNIEKSLVILEKKSTSL